VLPTPATRRLIEAVAADPARRRRARRVVAARRAGTVADRRLGVPVVSLSHGLEAGLPGIGLGVLVRRATRGLAALTTISDWAEDPGWHRTCAPPGSSGCRRASTSARFTPDVDGAAMRRSWGVPATPRSSGASRGWCRARARTCWSRCGHACATVTPTPGWCWWGRGRSNDGWPERSTTSAREPGRAGRPGPWEDLPACFAALDVFAMPCRTRLAGTDVEGLGIVYLEAAACGVPAVAGRSGGAPEAVRDGVTGSVVDGRDRDALVAALDRWLDDPDGRRRRAGEAGRRWVEERWSWEAIADRFSALLDEVVGADRGA
jgi:phosphatidyl-myo-inositol dimannoside synthase